MSVIIEHTAKCQYFNNNGRNGNKNNSSVLTKAKNNTDWL